MMSNTTKKINVGLVMGKYDVKYSISRDKGTNKRVKKQEIF